MFLSVNCFEITWASHLVMQATCVTLGEDPPIQFS